MIFDAAANLQYEACDLADAGQRAEAAVLYRKASRIYEEGGFLVMAMFCGQMAEGCVEAVAEPPGSAAA